MHTITALIKRRAMLAATMAFVIGCILVAWTLAHVLNDTESAQAVVAASDVPLDTAIEEQLPAEQITVLPAAIVVYVTGAVVAPDVYRLAEGARLKDLVIAAGGFLPDADPQAINLAEPLHDAAHIHIPHQGEVGASGASGTGSSVAPQAAESSTLINLNSASAAEFDALPGVGPALAERIVTYREEHGPFSDVADLANVKGIGDALIEKIAPLVTTGA